MLHPFSSASLRDWGLKQLKELLIYLNEKFDYKILLIGSKDQYKLLESISAENKNLINLAGITEILETI